MNLVALIDKWLNVKPVRDTIEPVLTIGSEIENPTTDQVLVTLTVPAATSYKVIEVAAGGSKSNRAYLQIDGVSKYPIVYPANGMHGKIFSAFPTVEAGSVIRIISHSASEGFHVAWISVREV